MPSKAQRTLLTNKKKKVFLDALADGVSVTNSAKLAGFSRRYMYDLREKLPEFAAEWDDAWEQGADMWRDLVRQRAIEGTLEPIVYQGVKLGEVHRRSDTMVIFATKARAPEFKDNAKIEVNVGDRLNELADAINGNAEEPEDMDVPEKGSPSE